MGKGKAGCAEQSMMALMEPDGREDKQPRYDTEREVGAAALRRFAPAFFAQDAAEIIDIIENRLERPGEYAMVKKLVSFDPSMRGKNEQDLLKQLKLLQSKDADALQVSWGVSQGLALQEIDEELPAIGSAQRRLEFMSVIYNRGKLGRLCSQEFMRNSLSFYLGRGQKIPRTETMSNWLETAGFSQSNGQSIWPQQTRGQRLLEEVKGEIAPFLLDAAEATNRAMCNGESRMSTAQASNDMDQLEMLTISRFGLIRDLKANLDYTRHQVNSSHGPTLETLFDKEATESFATLILNEHVMNGDLFERKRLEEGLRSIFTDVLDLPVAPELTQIDPVDIVIPDMRPGKKGAKVRAAIQVKTHFSKTPGDDRDQAKTELSLISGGGKKTPEATARDVLKRLSQTDIYLCVDIHSETRPGEEAETTNYHVNSIRPEVLTAIRKKIKADGLKNGSNTVSGVIKVDDPNHPGKKTDMSYGMTVNCDGGAVSFRNIPAHCMERVVSMTAPSPESCQWCVHKRFQQSVAKLASRAKKRKRPVAV